MYLISLYFLSAAIIALKKTYYSITLVEELNQTIFASGAQNVIDLNSARVPTWKCNKGYQSGMEHLSKCKLNYAHAMVYLQIESINNNNNNVASAMVFFRRL